MSEDLRTARRSKTYASISGDTDLVADGAVGQPCIRIRVGGAGALALQYADGATDTITDLLAGDVLEVSAAKILASGTTATKLAVFW